MKFTQRLNAPMIIGGLGAAILIAYLINWLGTHQVDPVAKMFAIVIVVSTIAVMCWFSGDNYSRDKAMQERAERLAAHATERLRQGLKDDLAEMLAALEIGHLRRQGEIRQQLEDVQDMARRVLVWLTTSGDDLGTMRIAVADITDAVDEMNKVMDRVPKMIEEAIAKGYVAGVRDRMMNGTAKVEVLDNYRRDR